jgi:hypothetical protein
MYEYREKARQQRRPIRPHRLVRLHWGPADYQLALGLLVLRVRPGVPVGPLVRHLRRLLLVLDFRFPLFTPMFTINLRNRIINCFEQGSQNIIS